MTEVIALGQPTVGDEELEAIAEVFSSGWLAGNGPMSRRLEAAFAQITASAHALAVGNCTEALHLGLIGLGVERGDAVIVADYTFPATGHAVMYVGAEPVFADVRSDIWTVDPAAVEAAVTERTVGIMAVDVFGQCADYDELRSIAERHGLWVLQDAAAATGARYRGRPAGSLADVACFSFHGRKGVTSGEGGALTTSRADIDAKARKLHAFGIESALARVESDELPVPVFDELGYNYKLSDVAAAIVLVQLRRLPDLIARRQRVADAYATLLGNLDGVTLPVCLGDRVHTWQAYVLTLAPEIDRSAVAFALRSEGIQCTFGTYASHVQPLYGDCKPCPTSADLFARQLAIPMHANLVDDQVERVAAAVRRAVTQHRYALQH